MKDYPAQYGHSELYRNPEGTNPFPRARDIPVTGWSQRGELPWGNGANTAAAPWGHVWNYTWSTPLFDLQPQLRAARGPSRQGQAVWDKGARLFVLITTSPTNVAFPTTGLGVTSTEFVAVSGAEEGTRPAEGGLTASPSVFNVATNDVTGLFTPTALGNPQAIQAGFAPPGNNLGFGEGHPIRYWRMDLAFTFTNETGLPIPAVPAVGAAGAPPFMQIQASVY